MANFICFLLVAVLGALLIDHTNADISCYLCSTLNTTAGGNCLVPDGTTAQCTSAFIGISSIGSSNAVVPVLVYPAPMCYVAVYYNGNRSPFRIDRGCGSAPASTVPVYSVNNWVGYNISYCASGLCNTFSASPIQLASSSYLVTSLTSLAAMVILYSEKMFGKW